MKLCTLANLKVRLGIEATLTDYDTQLDAVIEGVSARLQSHCNRLFERSETASEEFSGDDTEIRVMRYPIELVTYFEVKDGERLGWQTATVSDDSYVIRRECVISLYSPIASSRSQCRVFYIGGYVLPGTDAEEGQTALPEDIRLACEEQCAHWWQNRDRLGVASLSAPSGAVTSFAQLDLLPNVKATLTRHVRWNS